MASQAYVISFYAAGERRPSDCYGDFVATRSEAMAIGEEAVLDAKKARAWGDEGCSTAWIDRFTVSRVWLPNDFGTL